MADGFRNSRVYFSSCLRFVTALDIWLYRHPVCGKLGLDFSHAYVDAGLSDHD